MSLIDARITELKAALALLTTPRPISEYHEDMGDVLWWKFPIEEAPYCGTPNDIGMEVLIVATVHALQGEQTPYRGDQQQRVYIGGWPGYHTHWTPVPNVMAP